MKMHRQRLVPILNVTDFILACTLMIRIVLAKNTNDLKFLPPRIVVIDQTLTQTTFQDAVDNESLFNFSSPTLSPIEEIQAIYSSNSHDDLQIQTIAVNVDPFQLKIISTDDNFSRGNLYILDYALDKQLKKYVLENYESVVEVIFSTSHDWNERELLGDRKTDDDLPTRLLLESGAVTLTKTAIITVKGDVKTNNTPTTSMMNEVVENVLRDPEEISEIIGILKNSSTEFNALKDIYFLGRVEETISNNPHLQVTDETVQREKSGDGILILVVILGCVVAILSTIMVFKHKKVREIQRVRDSPRHEAVLKKTLETLSIPDCTDEEAVVSKQIELPSVSEVIRPRENSVESRVTPLISQVDASSLASVMRRTRYQLSHDDIEYSHESLHATLSMPSANADIMSCVTLPSFDFSAQTQTLASMPVLE